jgi:hypothetical protein
MKDPDERPSTPPPGSHDEERGPTAKKIVERLLKKGLESGIDAISKSEDTVRGVIEGLKIPKEMATLALEQIDETKNGLYRAVAKEVRDFLQSTNFAHEMKKILTGLAFEVKMEVRFKNTEDESGRSSVRPDVSADVALKDKDRPRRRKGE